MTLVRPLRIVIPGGSGQVGTILARHFHECGHDVSVLSRHKQKTEWKTVGWDGMEIGDWVKCISGADLVINLAGKSVNCRYTAANRREIKNSARSLSDQEVLRQGEGLGYSAVGVGESVAG